MRSVDVLSTSSPTHRQQWASYPGTWRGTVQLESRTNGGMIYKIVSAGAIVVGC